jgi:hypothetical protein
MPACAGMAKWIDVQINLETAIERMGTHADLFE